MVRSKLPSALLIAAPIAGLLLWGATRSNAPASRKTRKMPNFYQMRGRDTVCPPAMQPAWVYWVVQDSPDLTAVRCPVGAMICGANPPVDLADITIANEWTTDYAWPTARTLHVGQDPRMFPTIQAALDFIPFLSAPPSSTNRVTILIWPGKYISSAILDIPSYVEVKGLSKEQVQLQNDTTTLFRAAGSSVFLRDFLIEGSPTAGLYALDGNDQIGFHVRNVDMLHNGFTSRQNFLRQVGPNWHTMFVEHTVVDGYLTSGYLALIQNTDVAGPRLVDAHFNDCFWDTYHLTGFGGCMIVRACSDLYVRGGSFFRGGPNNFFTGIRHEKGGVLAGTPSIELQHSTISAVAPSVSVYTEAGTQFTSMNSFLDNAVFTGAHTEYNSTI
jgi:hypothetical protein